MCLYLSVVQVHARGVGQFNQVGDQMGLECTEHRKEERLRKCRVQQELRSGIPVRFPVMLSLMFSEVLRPAQSAFRVPNSI